MKRQVKAAQKRTKPHKPSAKVADEEASTALGSYSEPEDDVSEKASESDSSDKDTTSTKWAWLE